MARPQNRNIPIIMHIDNSREARALVTSVKEEITSKSEMIAAKRYSSGINSLFWQLSKHAALRLSREQIDLLPEDEKLVVRTASTFIK